MYSSSHDWHRDALAGGLPRSLPLALEFKPTVQAVVRQVRAVLLAVQPEHEEVAHDSEGRLERWEDGMLGEGVVREFAELPRRSEKERVLANVKQAGQHMAYTAQVGVVQPPTRAELFRTDSLAHPPSWLQPLVAAAPSPAPRPARVHALRGSSPPPPRSPPTPLGRPPHFRDADEQRKHVEQREHECEHEDDEDRSPCAGSMHELGGRRLDRRIGLRAAARYGIDPAAFSRGY